MEYCSQTFKSFRYCAFNEEFSGEENKHIHLVICFSEQVRFSTLQKNFQGAHIEPIRGTLKQCKSYLTVKPDDNNCTIIGEIKEFGECPKDSELRMTENEKVLKLVEDYDDFEDMYQNSIEFGVIKKYRTQLEDLFAEKIRQRDVPYLNRWDFGNGVQALYLYGNSGVGKSYIAKQIGEESCCRIVCRDNDVNFDDYRGEPVIILDEFNSSIPISQINNYLDNYKIKLHARYANKINHVKLWIIISNLSMNEQYKHLQNGSSGAIAQYNGFQRRFTCGIWHVCAYHGKRALIDANNESIFQSFDKIPHNLHIPPYDYPIYKSENEFIKECNIEECYEFLNGKEV